jgi:2-polyprenyl-3-methyl-5-hydroxy-6-metoxy-1,4-benzoquinol methylase
VKRLTAEEELTKQTYNKTAKKWASLHHRHGFWAAEMKQLQQLLPSGRVLEVGAGAGRDAKELLEHGYQYVGTDISSGLLNEARKVNPGAEFQEISIYDLNFSGLFDGFWCAAVLVHIPKSRINEALSAIRHNIRKGAVGFIATKEGAGEQMEDGDIIKTQQRLFVYWQNDELQKVLKENGFEVVTEGYRPVSSRSQWLTYIVRAI